VSTTCSIYTSSFNLSCLPFYTPYPPPLCTSSISIPAWPVSYKAWSLGQNYWVGTTDPEWVQGQSVDEPEAGSVSLKSGPWSHPSPAGTERGNVVKGFRAVEGIIKHGSSFISSPIIINFLLHSGSSFYSPQSTPQSHLFSFCSHYLEIFHSLPSCIFKSLIPSVFYFHLLVLHCFCMVWCVSYLWNWPVSSVK
jgi:hypothetical protein